MEQQTWYMALIQGGTAIPKSVAKLIDTVGSQVGLFLEPSHIRKKGRAEADVRIVNAKADAEIAIIEVDQKLAIQKLEDRAAERVRQKEIKRQRNLEAITTEAAKELPHEVSDNPVDEDWITQFFDECQDINDNQMQTLWGRILAGEVANPGSFSLRALALVKTMSKDDAQLFSRLCTMIWADSTKLVLLWPNKSDSDMYSNPVKISFTELVRLDAIGLIKHETGFGNFCLNFEPINNEARLGLYYHNQLHMFCKKAPEKQLPIGPILLTDIGTQLARIAGADRCEEYRKWVIDQYQKDHWEVNVRA